MLVLVVDDSKFMRSRLTGALVNHGWQVCEAPNGREAVKLYHTIQPTVVMMDISMPELDGLGALQRIKQMDREAKVIVVSAWSSKENILKAMELGACDFLVKPINDKRMIEAIERACPAHTGVDNLSPLTR